MRETDDELRALQRLLDVSAEQAGPHMASIITADRRLSAAQVCERLQAMCLFVVATVTADGRPIAGPVDGYLLHGSVWFSSGSDSVRIRHLRSRPALSASHVPHEQLQVTVHGTAELFDIHSPEAAELREEMLAWYVPRQGPEFEQWLEGIDGAAVRIDAARMFTFHMEEMEE